MRKVILLVLLLLAASTLQAQTCALSADDCALLRESGEMMGTLESVVFHLDMSMSMRDDQGFMGEEVTFRLVGDGSYIIGSDPAAVFGGMPDISPARLEAALRSIGLDMTLVVELPPLLARGFSRGTSVPERLSLQLRMVDGYGYVNLDKLATLDSSVQPGWHGIDIAGAFRLFAGLQPMAPPPAPLENDALYPIQRLDDTEIGGQAMGVFSTSLLFKEVLEDPQIRRSFEDAFRAQGFGSGADRYIKLFDTLFFEIVQTIGLTDKYLHKMQFNLSWQPNMADLMAFSGQGRTAFDNMNVDFGMNFQIDFSQFNAAPPVSAPPNAKIIPLTGLLPLFFGSGLGGQT